MKTIHQKFFLLLAITGLFALPSFAQRTGERRSSGGGTRSFTPSGNNQPRFQQAPRPTMSQPPRNNNSFNQPRPSTVTQTPRPIRDVNSNNGGYTPRPRPTRPQPGVDNPTVINNPRPTQLTTQNQTGNSIPRPRRPQPAPQVPTTATLNPTPAEPRPNTVNNRPPSGNPGYNNNRPGDNITTRRGRGGNTYVYNDYRGNNYFNRNYYSTRPRVVYNAYNPSWRYNYYPRRHTRVTIFPFSYSSIFWGGYNYRYYDGIFYQPFDNYYSVVAPPIGIYINTLPIGYSRILVRDNPYYYYNGTYYNQDNDRYTVVQPPLGAIVESIPEGYETVVIDGETYYKVDDVQYKPVVQENGEIWYEVIKVG